MNDLPKSSVHGQTIRQAFGSYFFHTILTFVSDEARNIGRTNNPTVTEGFDTSHEHAVYHVLGESCFLGVHDEILFF